MYTQKIQFVHLSKREIVLVQGGGVSAAGVVAACREELERNPANLKASYDLGVALVRSGRARDALRHLSRVVKFAPDNTELRLTYAQALVSAAQNEKACAELDQALALSPDKISLLFNAAAIYRAAGRFEPAVECFSRLVSLKPDEPSAYSNLANALTRAGQVQAAFVHYRRAIELDPKSAVYQFNYGKAHAEVANYDAAEKAYRTAIELQPDFADAHWALSQLLWLQGDMEAAWAHYEMRLYRRGFERRTEIFSKPAWDGRGFRGKTLLFYGEQGYGDAIQFVRYAELIKERGGRIIVECRPGLSALFRRLPAVDLVVERGNRLPPFDYQLSMMSAPVVFNTIRETIPGKTPYLFARPEDGFELPGDPASYKVGLVWAGNPANQPADSRRSFPLSSYSSLMNLEGVQFYSLQVGEPARQLAGYTQKSRIIDLGPRLSDFAVTASVVERLNLVISPDTSMAHLLGALGRECWLVLNSTPEFRWFLEGSKSDWYESLNLFRAKERDNWTQIMSEVREALRPRLRERS